MKLVILITLFTFSLSAFAQSSFSMNATNRSALADFAMAQLHSRDVQFFAQHAHFDSLKVTYNADKTEATIKAKGIMIIEGDIACGDLELTIIRSSHTAQENRWNTYATKLDTSDIQSYCQNIL